MPTLEVRRLSNILQVGSQYKDCTRWAWHVSAAAGVAAVAPALQPHSHLQGSCTVYSGLLRAPVCQCALCARPRPVCGSSGGSAPSIASQVPRLPLSEWLVSYRQLTGSLWSPVTPRSSTVHPGLLSEPAAELGWTSWGSFIRLKHRYRPQAIADTHWLSGSAGDNCLPPVLPLLLCVYTSLPLSGVYTSWGAEASYVPREGPGGGRSCPQP